MKTGQRTKVWPPLAVAMEDLLKSKVSMLSPSGLPRGYSMLETDYDIRDHVFGNSEDNRVVRMQIVWDLPASALEDVEEVVDRMRERGAAMVVTAEEVKR